METNLLQTKLYIPSLRPSLVPRPHLIAKLDEERPCKLILLSAPAGYGKTTLVTEWIDRIQKDTLVCWLSLEEDDSDPHQFFRYLAAAIRPLPNVQASLPPLLQSPLPLPAKNLMAAFVNDVTAVSTPFHLILDDYHAIDSPEIDAAMAFLLDHMPPHMTLVITSRSDPGFPISRLRARGHLTELRAEDLRFTEAEAAQFLQQSMGLTLSPDQIAALESRTEGWIAGLQMAAIALQNRNESNVERFVAGFTGSHRFVLDYLLEEVLCQQPDDVQEFLLKTAVLNQLTAPLCNALTGDNNGLEILEMLERANLFLVPLDNERRWYRYHHLFADLLRQRLQQSATESMVNALHIRASQWYEANGLEAEAFHHAAEANDVERAARLIEGEGLPLYFRAEATPVRRWLASLPETEFKARPSLWVTYASVLIMTGRMHNDIEDILQAAETALPDPTLDDKTVDLHGQIAAIRAMLGIVKNEAEKIITQSRRALEMLHPDNAPMRTITTWTLGYAYQIQGKRAAASRAYEETLAHSQKSGNIMTEIAATTSLGQIQESENQLHRAAASFKRILELMGDPPWPGACEAFVGLARIHYQWHDLETAEKYGQQGLALARRMKNVDTPAACGVLLARVKLARGDTASALATLAEAEQFVQQHHFDHWVGEITAVRIQTLLHQDDLTAAAQLAETHDLPLSQARVKLAQGDPAVALAVLEPVYQKAEQKAWQDQKLEARMLQALAYWQKGEGETAVVLLQDALAIAKPGGLIRLFVDEGPPMARLLYDALARGIEPAYIRQLMAAFPAADAEPARPSLPPEIEAGYVEPLSEREIEVLQFIAEGLTNQEVANRLYLSLHTVKVHARNIYGKLGVKNRTQAVAKARALGILVSGQ